MGRYLQRLEKVLLETIKVRSNLLSSFVPHRYPHTFIIEDLDLPIWSGLVPLETVTKPVIPDPTMTKDLPVPSYITNYERFKPAK